MENSPVIEKPKIGVMKIGANITFSASMNRTAANYDIISLSRALAPNFDLHFITRKTRNTLMPPQVAFTDILQAKDDINSLGLDAIIVFNGNFNAYGGVEPKETIAIWKCINEFKGRVFYVQTDGQMHLSQIWDGFEKRGWSDHWSKEEIVITRDDIVYITQGKSMARMRKLIRSKNSINIKDENFIHFPVQEAVLLRPPKFKLERKIGWDLIYGGSYRNGNRRERMLKWFFGHEDLKVLMFGNLSLQRFGGVTVFPVPEFEGAVPNSDFMHKMRTGLATVQIVDDWYENHWVTLRFYESLISGVIPFVDNIADRKQSLYYPDSVIRDFLYVQTRKELNDRINLIKREDCADEIMDECRDAIRKRWDKDVYIQKLKQTICRYL